LNGPQVGKTVISSTCTALALELIKTILTGAPGPPLVLVFSGFFVVSFLGYLISAIAKNRIVSKKGAAEKA
jgi:hypothetical protein